MKYTVFNKEMRMFENSLDQKIAPDVFLVARLDGRGFTRLTKELLALDKPFDARFRDAMVETVKSTMQCGFNMLYGYTQSDEISLLFAPDENTFSRKVRKLTSILAGQASAQLSLQLGMPAVFDCRLVPLPDEQHVADYFRWRAEDANRNALNAWCYWTLRKEGASVQQATGALNGISTQAKRELLKARQIMYNDLPLWQKRGTGLYYETEMRNGVNPFTGQGTVIERMQLRCDTDLPVGTAYDMFIKTILAQRVLQ
jgi:tRNA(His) 5'-end guanylyltransferase